MIEIMRFKLAASAREDDFLRADRAVQEDFGYHQPGLMRRTTAHDSRGIGSSSTCGGRNPMPTNAPPGGMTIR